nr:immunoglobulin light chain junction region [Macaca mulatta]MOW58064.1 immunoglobulin light chain junction region [Macaca mulatta]MOW60376.1 immunoglobulin light chain junction region [Macaca mulatta]MOW60682.1 immunoglobulin light chain junction region [Macaca mulatta]
DYYCHLIYHSGGHWVF